LTQSGAKVKATVKSLEIYRPLFCHARTLRCTAQIEQFIIQNSSFKISPERFGYFCAPKVTDKIKKCFPMREGLVAPPKMKNQV
jgi:hypothetical protein